MNEQTALFVQFPHPGGEHLPADDEMQWNVDAHGRKFLRATGSYADAEGVSFHRELVFWGEWEPPSRIAQRWPANGALPRALHVPYWTRPGGSSFRQNTDPWVYGNQMIYSYCKQVSRRTRSRTLSRLPRGSVICFGSAVRGAFCLDTVFVVDSAQPWTPVTADRVGVDDAYVVCTADSIVTVADHANVDLMLYRGATYDNPVLGMYSLAPALPATEDGPRFARPPAQLESLINPANTQSTLGTKRPLPIPVVHDAWRSLRAQVLAAGLVLAVRIDTPPEQVTDRPVLKSTRTNC